MVANGEERTSSIARVAIEGYRAFPKRVEIELRPITLLFGFNSVGKSALLRALPLIAFSAQSSSQAPLDLDAPIGRGASFSDLLARQHDRPSLAFELVWNEAATSRVSYEVRELPELRQQVINRMTATRLGADYTFLWEPGLFDAGPSRKYSVTVDGKHQGEATIQFEGLSPSEWMAPSRQTEQVLSSISRQMRQTAREVHWLGALRDLVPRREAYIGQPTRLDSRGSRTSQAIAYDELRGGALRETISRWYEKATGNSLIVETSTAADAPLFSLKLVPVSAPPVRIDVVDTGEGMGQVLPVLALSSMAGLGHLGTNPIIAIEHPELHLQPSVHALLAEHFISSIASEANAKFLIETHSENFLLRLQLALINKEIKPDDLSVYWVRRDETGQSIVELVEFDNAGRPVANNWPSEAFSQSLDQSKAIVRARQRSGV